MNPQPVKHILDGWEITISFRRLEPEKTFYPVEANIINAVAAATGISFQRIKSKARNQEVSQARQALCLLLTRLMDYSQGKIAKLIKRTPGCICHDISVARHLCKTNKSFYWLVTHIQNRFLDSPLPDMQDEAEDCGGRGSTNALGAVLHEVGNMRILRDKTGAILAAVQDELKEPSNGETKGNP